jgi:molecular chaperone GrpE (heat shock protein)
MNDYLEGSTVPKAERIDYDKESMEKIIQRQRQDIKNLKQFSIASTISTMLHALERLDKDKTLAALDREVYARYKDDFPILVDSIEELLECYQDQACIIAEQELRISELRDELGHNTVPGDSTSPSGE